ncbi:unnamed protein product [Amoebophrya sp. A25]|nr:unnamed protein product [Amoebophrya sp. A25]|eukprot:GSA25T00018088001.1
MPRRKLKASLDPKTAGLTLVRKDRVNLAQQRTWVSYRDEVECCSDVDSDVFLRYGVHLAQSGYSNIIQYVNSAFRFERCRPPSAPSPKISDLLRVETNIKDVYKRLKEFEREARKASPLADLLLIGKLQSNSVQFVASLLLSTGLRSDAAVRISCDADIVKVGGTEKALRLRILKDKVCSHFSMWVCSCGSQTGAKFCYHHQQFCLPISKDLIRHVSNSFSGNLTTHSWRRTHLLCVKDVMSVSGFVLSSAGRRRLNESLGWSPHSRQLENYTSDSTSWNISNSKILSAATRYYVFGFKEIGGS